MSWNVRGINKKSKQVVVLEVSRINKIGIGALLETKIKGDKLKDAMGTCFQGWNYHNSIRKFCFTVVYGSNQLDTRKLLWCILHKELEDARNWLDLGLVEEMKLLGTFYTWSNNQEGDNRIYSKLDRVFVNEDWLDVFPSVIAVASWEVSFDHCAIFLKQSGISHPQFRSIVLTNWNKDLRIKGSGLDQVYWKLVRLKHDLKKFNWRIIGDVARSYEDCKTEFQKARSDLFSDPQNQILASAERVAFQRFKQQEKIYGSNLRQKSKIEWIQFGNENSSYFHAYIKQWKRANRITSYISEDGKVEDSYPKVISHFINHFKSVLGCSNKASGKVDYVITDLGPVLSVEDQLALIKPFSNKEVKTTLFCISSIKRPGPDSFGAGFFKSLWKDMGKEISKAVLEFFDSGIIPKAMNSTILTLIPKMDHPKTAADFRPITCCTTLYKCISKMLCYRVSGILPKLVNQNQGAFIKDRSLAHNVLILQDLLKGYKRKYSSPRCLMKIDLSKAYDSIDWDFLENLLKAFKFPDRFIRWIMTCMRGASYCLMLNGRLHGNFQGGKGLRQGDPISPLLFVIVMEYLTRSLLQAAKGKANSSSIHIIQHSLEEFSAASGLLKEGEFPMTYLGLPLRPTKWKAMDCDLILKKVRQRLCVWASRNLSYAGRVQLIQSILLGIRNYWMSIFLLPKSVLKEIDHLCRIFLWGGKGNRSKFHLTSWELVCCPKSHGGLGFKEGPLWNRMLLSKFIWAISSKQDLLWVKWVNCIYLKGIQIWDYKLHPDASWYWKKLIKISKDFPFSLLVSASANGKLILSRLYHLVLSSSPKPFMNSVWCSTSVPNHKFILWQEVLQKLATRDLLSYCHVPLPSLLCPICDLLPENHSHLFFECVFSRRVVQVVFEWLQGFCWPPIFTDWCSWLEADRNNITYQITIAALAASVYYIWLTRNRCHFDSSCFMVSTVTSLIKTSVSARLIGLKLRSKARTSRAIQMTQFLSSLY
ncbi:uncharacterized protein LOC133779496 [Humulus lupulus]|uniref:uncharacterized protein LOC133779496 n=1 Tax=Humulus lupulus TaxID=3486 RepID=UPI002B4036DD|nr:uncharacterized protein LOC133779496 [Humulus lupulus]